MSTNEKKKKKSSLLSRLRVAVQKVKLLLNATVLSHAWHAATILRGVSMSKRQISFNDRPGLMMCTASSDETDSEGLVSPAHHSLQRTISCPSDDDIDKRAEMFISNFRRQLNMERQISLQLRYCSQNSFELVSPWLIVEVFLFIFKWRTLCFFQGRTSILQSAMIAKRTWTKFVKRILDWFWRLRFFFFFSFVKFWIFGIVLFLCDLQRLEGPGSICCFC